MNSAHPVPLPAPHSNVLTLSTYTGYTWLYEVISLFLVLYLPKLNTNEENLKIELNKENKG